MWNSLVCFSALLILAVVQACQPLVKPPRFPDVIDIAQLPDEIKKVTNNLLQLDTERGTKWDALRKANAELNFWLPSDKAKREAALKEYRASIDKKTEEERKLEELKIVQKVIDYDGLSKEQWQAKLKEVVDNLEKTKAELKEAEDSIAKKQAAIDKITSTDDYKRAKQASDEYKKRISLIALHMRITEELKGITNPTMQAEKMKVLKEIKGIVTDVETVTKEKLEEEKKAPAPSPPFTLDFTLQEVERKATDAKNSIHLLEYEKWLLEKKIVS